MTDHKDITGKLGFAHDFSKGKCFKCSAEICEVCSYNPLYTEYTCTGCREKEFICAYRARDFVDHVQKNRYSQTMH